MFATLLSLVLIAVFTLQVVSDQYCPDAFPERCNGCDFCSNGVLCPECKLPQRPYCFCRPINGVYDQCLPNLYPPQLCRDLTPCPQCYATTTPTSTPSVAFTKKPTRKPTITPTSSPSEAPTSKPNRSRKPTRTPTQLPSSSPSVSPTRVPSRSPTRNPTQIPSKTPTLVPTQTPSLAPTLISIINNVDRPKVCPELPGCEGVTRIIDGECRCVSPDFEPLIT